MVTSSMKPRVAVIGCGGTISSVSPSTLDVLDYPEFGSKLEVAEVIARVPEITGFAECLPVSFLSVGSTAMGPGEWHELARLIDELDRAHPDLAGFVVPHGTATLEESAYILNLVVKTAKPVVIVGAQRPSSALSTDAGMNLLAAIRTAISEGARGLGVLVVLNDEIHAAREVTKTSTYRLQTFKSPDFGLLGHVDGDGVVFYRRPTRRHTGESAFGLESVRAMPRVDIAYSYGGADGTAIDAFVAAGAKGIVSAGLAPGIPTPAELDALQNAARSGVIIVQASRAGSGRVARRRYLREADWVGADNLNPQKARILLSLALTKTQDPTEIQAYFASH